LSEPPFLVRAPGRVCLFGEHSDYLGLDVIAAAIDMEIAIVAEPRTDNEVHISYSDLGEEDMFSLVWLTETDETTSEALSMSWPEEEYDHFMDGTSKLEELSLSVQVSQVPQL
jgi:galactokinase